MASVECSSHTIYNMQLVHVWWTHIKDALCSFYVSKLSHLHSWHHTYDISQVWSPSVFCYCTNTTQHNTTNAYFSFRSNPQIGRTLHMLGIPTEPCQHHMQASEAPHTSISVSPQWYELVAWLGEADCSAVQCTGWLQACPVLCPPSQCPLACLLHMRGNSSLYLYQHYTHRTSHV